MSIVSRVISEQLPHSGRLRIRLEYITDDGRTFTRGPMFVANEIEANAKLLELELGVLESIQNSDADDAVNSDLEIGSVKQASNKQVARQYLKTAMLTVDPYAAYLKLKKANDYFAAQSWTNADIKAFLSLSDSQWSSVVTRFQYLVSNLPALLEYQDVLDNDPFTGEL